MRIFLVLALVLSLLVTIFAVQNNAPIQVSFLSWDVTGSLALVLMITLLLGILIGVMLILPGSVRASLAAREERKRKSDLAVQLEKSQASRAEEAQPAFRQPDASEPTGPSAETDEESR